MILSFLMSILKTKYIQIGNDLVANNNFTIYQPAVADGTLRFAYGTADGIKTDVIRFSNTGNISITGNTIYSDLSTTGNTKWCACGRVLLVSV